jgi:hypothetical protein
MSAQIIQLRPKVTRAEREPDAEELLTLRLLRQIAINLGLPPDQSERPKGSAQ